MIKAFRNLGFTLVEVMIVLTVIAIMAMFVAPEVMNFRPNMRIKAAAGDLFANLQKMKVEAVKSNNSVLITFNPVACPAHPSATVPSPGGTYTIDATTYNLPEDTAICVNATLPAGATVFQFTPRGLWLDSAGFALGGDSTFQLQNRTGRAYQVVVSLAGGIKNDKL